MAGIRPRKHNIQPTPDGGFVELNDRHQPTGYELDEMTFEEAMQGIKDWYLGDRKDLMDQGFAHNRGAGGYSEGRPIMPNRSIRAEMDKLKVFSDRATSPIARNPSAGLIKPLRTKRNAEIQQGASRRVEGFGNVYDAYPLNLDGVAIKAQDLRSGKDKLKNSIVSNLPEGHEGLWRDSQIPGEMDEKKKKEKTSREYILARRSEAFADQYFNKVTEPVEWDNAVRYARLNMGSGSHIDIGNREPASKTSALNSRMNKQKINILEVMDQIEMEEQDRENAKREPSILPRKSPEEKMLMIEQFLKDNPGAGENFSTAPKTII